MTEYNNIRGVCPVCGYKYAKIEEYDSYSQEGNYHVRRIRCPRNILNKASRNQKKRVGGCGKITVVEKKKIRKRKVM